MVKLLAPSKAAYSILVILFGITILVRLIVSLKAEHSNFHQGTMVQLIKKDILDKFITYM